MDGGTPIRVAARGLILAAGVSPGLLRQAGLTAPNRYLVGAHAELEMDGVAETEVYLLPDLDRGAFAWLVPLDHRTVRFGVLAHRSAAALARRFLQRPSIRSGWCSFRTRLCNVRGRYPYPDAPAHPGCSPWGMPPGR